MMLLLSEIRHGSHLARRVKQAHGLSFTVRKDRRSFSKVAIYGEDLSSASFETSGSPLPSWPKDGSHGMWEQQTVGRLEKGYAIGTTQTEPRIRDLGEKQFFTANLSQAALDVLDFAMLGPLRCLVYDRLNPSTSNLEEAIKRRAVEEFDKACRFSGQQGFSSLALAAAHLAKSLSPNICMSMRARRPVIQGLWIEAPGQHKLPIICISLRSTHIPKVQAPGTPTFEETPYHFTTVLVANAYSEPQSNTSITSTLLPAKEEINFLRSTSNMVFSRLCSEMQFQTPLVACQNLAEALLRVLRFRTPYLSLTAVKLVAESTGHGANKCVVQASWRDSIDVVTSVEEAKKRPVDVEVIEDGSSGQHNAGIAPQSDSNDVEIVDSTAPVNSTEISCWSRKILQLTKTWRHLVPSGSDELTSALRLQRIPSETAKRRFGTPFVRFPIKWDPKFASSLVNLQFIKILTAIDATLQAAENSSVASLVRAVQGVARTVPHIRGIHFCLESVADSTYPCGASNPGTGRVLFKVLLDTLKASSQFKIVLPAIALSASMHQGLESASKRTIILNTQFCWNYGDLEHWHGKDVNDVAKDIHANVYRIASSVTRENHFASYYDVANAVTKAVRSSTPSLSRAITIRTSAAPMPAVKSGMSSLVFSSASGHVEAFIALGSNVGDRLNMIEQACRALGRDQNIRLLETSPLYETKAMYVEDQESFVNGVCKIETDLPAMQLLDRLQAIENDLGRVKIIDKGPRSIDLDILTYGNDIIRSERLTVPHALMHEREFVLRPMSDTSGRSFMIARLGRAKADAGSTALQWLHRLPSSDPPMYALTPLSPGSESLRSLSSQRRTMVMSILNVTPDSFSDGGDYHNSDMDALRQTVATHIAEGATIIDIGGQSSRPNAPDITAEEEISRILPAIEAIKSLPEASNIAISIDTYRASVAEAAIKAGAHIINDISAGLLDPEMLPTIARLGCTYIMMHMRGTPATMQSEQNTSYPDGLIPTIAAELQSRLQAAQEAGIRRWRIILDPGVGFAKTTEQNAELLGKFSELRNWKGLATYPWLVGSSRKGFIGILTGATEAKDRVEGTAATVTAAVAGGAEIVRVHDVKEMVRVVKMADAMYRSG